jgi:predicted phosphodiesterase
VLVALADTHSRDDPRLTDHLRDRVAAADCVLHAGDFTTAAGLDAFEGLTERLVAVRDNSDDAVVLGHTHVPGTERVGGVAVINPGSHADPRGSRPAYATLEPGDGELRGRLHTPEGEVFAAFRVQGPERKQAVEGGPQFG